MVIAGTKGRIALGALSLTSFVTRSEAVVTEAMEALGQDSVLALNFAGWTRQRLFVLPDLLLQNFIRHRITIIWFRTPITNFQILEIFRI